MRAFTVTVLLLLGLPQLARAERCPANQPAWLRGRVVVNEPNLKPPALRGVGEVFVFAYQRGATPASLRRMAVTDSDGYFCIHDTVPGEWAVTSLEPFTFRPFVRELTCAAGACDLGEVRVDENLFRISDDYVNFEQDGTMWWGGPYAQTIVFPAGATQVTKVTIRSGAGSVNPVKAFAGETVSGQPIASSVLRIPNSTGGGRGTAFFHPGQWRVSGGEKYTLLFEGGMAPWRLAQDAYPAGQMFTVAGATLNALAGKDLCTTVDFDGLDGNVTNFVMGMNGAYIWVGATVAQSFVAHSSDITHASVFTGTPAGFRRVRASISESLNGPAIGPEKETIGLDQQGVAFAWFKGEVPVTPGKTYFVRFNFPEGGRAVYTQDKDPQGNPPFPPGTLYADGNVQQGALAGRVLGTMPVAVADAGVTDAGTSLTDAGTPNQPDGGALPPVDGGTDPGPDAPRGCGCGAGGDGLLALGILLLRRRKTP